MNEELSRGFGNVEAVLKELLNGEQRFVVEALYGVFLENFLEESLAKGCREVIDKSCDTEIVVGNDILVRIENLADLESGLRLLERARQILNSDNGRAYADVNLCEELARKRIRDTSREFFEVFDVDVVLNLLDENDIVFGDIENEVLVLVGEKVLNNIVS